MMMRPPLVMCFSAACVAAKVPRTLISITRSSSSSVVSSNLLGMAVPALFTSTSSRAEGRDGLFDRGFAGVGIGGVRLNRDRLTPAPSISLTTDAAASAPFRVCDGHVRSVRGQTLSDCSTDAARAARNECNLSFEFLRHSFSPLFLFVFSETSDESFNLTENAS
jgi:hypothetical protein